MEQLLAICNNCFKVTMRVLGPIIFTAANVLACSIIYILIFILTPPLLAKSVFLYAINMSYIIWGSVNIYFNYWACMLTPPGSPSLCNDPASILGCTQQTTKDGEKVYKAITNLEVAPGVAYKYCQACPCVKPPRAHHCRYLSFPSVSFFYRVT
jgi:hypothetical protein